jgi:hypothetical protein
MDTNSGSPKRRFVSLPATTASAPVAKRAIVRALAETEAPSRETKAFIVPAVTLGDVVGDQLRQVGIDLKHRAKSATKIEEILPSSALGFPYARPRNISIGYLRSTKPQCEVLLRNEVLPKIHYPDGSEYGDRPYIRMADDKYATSMANEVGVDVLICHKGMSLFMTREDSGWYYWPVDKDGDILRLPLRGKVREELIEARSAIFQAQEDQIVHAYKCHPKHIVVVIEVVCEDGSKFDLVVVKDTEGNTRVVEISHTEEFFS